MLHALGFRLSFSRRAAPNLKKGSVTLLCNHPLVFHSKGPARARQSLATIFVFPSACVFSFGLGGPPRGLAPTAFSCAAAAAPFYFVCSGSRGGVARYIAMSVFFSSARCFCFWLVSGGCRPWLPLSLCVFGSRACVCVCSRGSGDGPARLCQKHVLLRGGK